MTLEHQRTYEGEGFTLTLLRDDVDTDRYAWTCTCGAGEDDLEFDDAYNALDKHLEDEYGV